MSVQRGADSEPPSSTVVDAVELLATKPTAPEFLVEHLIPKRSIVLLSGDTGSGKSALKLHLAVAVATDNVVAGRFPVTNDGRPVLFLNGEMSTDDARRYLAVAEAGLGAKLGPDRLFFEGAQAVADFRFSNATQKHALMGLVDRLRPSLVIFDTMRALFEIDENETAEVRRSFGWLRSLANVYDLTALVGHHQRKLSAVSNSDRERVAGSRDIIASVDVHFVARARSGEVAHSLVLDKTRTPFRGVTRGTEWPLRTHLEFDDDGVATRSVFVAEASSIRHAPAAAVDTAVEELRANLEAEGPLTIEQLGADRGNAKRAYERLRDAGEAQKVGKVGRKDLIGLCHPAPTLNRSSS